MRLRKLALAVGLAGALGAEMASAVGLGEIKLLSTLNEPLEAEIKLLQANELSENEVLIGLASSDDFQRAGIDRLYFLTDLKFTVKLDGASGPVIRVTSRKPVREPYLNFLLETQWPNGRILREYTLLMDLPVFSDDSVRPVESARTAPVRKSQPSTSRTIPQPPRQQAAPVAEPEPEQTVRRSVPRAPSKPSYTGDVFGPVGASDTLWEIALKVRQDRGYSVQQTMLAIQRLNPDAFINGNINLLKKGQVLRVPSAADIDAVTARQAINEVAYQNTQWSGNADGSTSGAQLEGSKRRASGSSTAQQTVSGRLKVAGAESRENLQAGRAAGEVGGDVESLQNELAISMEELDRSRRENSELNDRVQELEDQIQTMERLLEVSSQELRALQLSAEANQETADSVAQNNESDVSSSVDSPVAAAEPQAQVEQAQAAPAPQKADPTKVVRSAKPKEPSIMDMIMDNILYIGGGLAAILGGVFLLMRRRQQQEEEETLEFAYDEPVEAEPEDDSFVDDTVVADINESVEEVSEFEESVLDDSELDGSLGDLDLEDSVPTESQTGDAVGEADIYIAYGKFDQAEEMLANALAANPDDSAARLKLMEVYVETQDLDKFDNQYGQVQATGDADIMARANDLREQFDNAPAYIDMDDAPLESVSEVESKDLASGDNLDLNEDFGLSFESDLTAAEPASESPTDDEFTLDIGDEVGESELEDDLSLDLDLDLESESAELESEIADADIEFDLGLDDSEAEPSGEVSSDLDLGDDADLSLELADGDSNTDDFGLDFDLGDDANTDDSSFEAAAETGDDLGLDLDLGEGSETELLEETSSIVGSDGESDLDLGELSLDIDEAPEAQADSEGGEFELDLSEETSVDTDSSDIGDFDFEATDLDADLAALDSDIDSDLSLDIAEDASTDGESIDLPAEDDVVAEPQEASADDFDLSLDVSDDADAFDVDMGDIDLDALDQEVDALAADMDSSDVDSEFDLQADTEAADEFELGELETDSNELSLQDDAAESAMDMDAGELDLSSEFAEAADEPEVSFDSLDDVDEAPVLDLADLDAEVPTLEAADESASATEEPELLVDEAPSEVEEVQSEFDAGSEPEFDLAADLGLSAEDLEATEDASSEDDVFTEALSDLPAPEDVMGEEGVADEDLDAELDFLADTDEAATKLDLARAYIDMGDQEGAKDILDEVVQEGNDEQKQQAEELLSRMG